MPMRRGVGQLLGRALEWASGAAAPACAPAWQPAALAQAAGWRAAAASFVQHAGIRTRHAAKPTKPRAPRSAMRRAATAAGAAAGLAAVGLPLAGIAALVVAGRDDADAAEIIRSLPRTARVVWWGAWASYKYKALAARYGGDQDAYQQALAELHEAAAARLLLTVQHNGGVYIKAGQLAVSLNAVPPQYRSTLESLQDRVPPRPAADVEPVLVSELGAPPAQLFAEFEPRATAAASLAQVHRARLHDGTQVAVKVQYPGLQSAVSADLATMLALSDAAHLLFPATSWRWLFEELQRQLRYELDFRNEAANAARLAAALEGRRDVAVPRVEHALSTTRVVTMQWVEGCKLTDVECLVAAGFRPRDVALLLLDVFAQQTCAAGFTHGDPHPGNLLVRARPDPPTLGERLLGGGAPRPQLVVLDHGVYVELPEKLRRLYCQLWGAILLADWPTARVAAAQLGGERAGRILPELLRPRDWRAVPQEERRRVRQEAGISSFADLAAVLTEAPRPLLDSLRQSAVVRHSATLLGATLGDRLRINATWAVRGMWASSSAHPAFVGGLQSRVARWRLSFRVGLLRVAAWLAATLQDVAALVLPSLA